MEKDQKMMLQKKDYKSNQKKDLRKQMKIYWQQEKQNSLLSVFNEEKRQFLWQELIKSNAIQFIPKLLPNSGTVSKYLRENSHQIVVKYCLTINQYLNQNIMDLSNQQIIALNLSINQLIKVLKSNNLEDASEWYLQYIGICELILEQLNCEDQIVNSSQDFSQFLDIFYNLKYLQMAFEECQKQVFWHNQNVNQCQHLLILNWFHWKKKENLKRRQIYSKKCYKMKRRKEMRFNNNFQQKWKKIRIIKLKQRSFTKNIENYQMNEQQIQDYNKQIQQLQVEQQEIMEKRRQENEQKMDQLVQTINNLQQQFQNKMNKEEQRSNKENKKENQRDKKGIKKMKNQEEKLKKLEEKRRKIERNKEFQEERKRDYETQQKFY